MKKAVRKISTIHSIDELKLSSETARALKATQIGVEELITAARNDVIWQKYMSSQANKSEANKLTKFVGIGESRAAEIIKAVDKAGFLLHESEQSCNARCLLAAVLGSPVVFEEYYESLREVSSERLRIVNEIIESVCPKRFIRTFKLYTGFEDGHRHTVKECAEMVGVVPGIVLQTYRRVLSKLRNQNRVIKLKAAVLYSDEALVCRVDELEYTISACQQELNILKATSLYKNPRRR